MNSNGNDGPNSELLYCDCERRVNHESNNCHFANHSVISLVSSQHKKYWSCRIGEQMYSYSGYTFEGCLEASLKARIRQRFATLDNDRNEHIIDLLTAILHSNTNLSELLKDISVTIEKSGGTRCQLLQTIADAFGNNVAKESAKRGNPSNTSSADKRVDISPVVESIESLREVLTDIQSSSLALNANTKSIGYDMKVIKAKSVANEELIRDMKSEIIKNREELSKVRTELVDIKKEVKELREAIVNVLPNRLVEAFKGLAHCKQ